MRVERCEGGEMWGGVMNMWVRMRIELCDMGVLLFG